MHKTICFLILCGGVFFQSCTIEPPQNNTPIPQLPDAITNQVKLSSEIEWEQLNPARGDQSPQAGTIWGDRKGEVATGFLAKFVDGFSSPPHIHNVSYRAVVINGLVHNDDPAAEKMWMPTGSYWTQPAGEAHITAVKGSENIAYVEIESGPYLVWPTEQANDNGERPINVDYKNLVWLDWMTTPVIENSPNASKTRIAFLWQEEKLQGYMLKLEPGFKGSILSDGNTFRAIVITGTPDYRMPNASEAQTLDPGSSFSSTGISIHPISTSGDAETLLYIRADGNLRVTS
ncbi:MAG: DUF4437 domain-containing protein [Bacteroidota bacterium]